MHLIKNIVLLLEPPSCNYNDGSGITEERESSDAGNATDVGGMAGHCGV
jgi:hypothetical protein